MAKSARSLSWKGVLITTAGRILAVRPKSTNQTSPRRAFGMAGLSLVVRFEGFVSSGNQVRLGFNAMTVVINNAATPLAKLPVNRLLHAH